MTPVLRSEFRKLRYTRSLLALILGGVVVAVVGVLLLLLVGKPVDIGESLSHFGPLRFGPSNFGLLIVLFGVRLFADETQHGTLAGTFMRTPNRRRALGAKAVIAAASAATFCAVVYLLVIPLAVVGLGVRDLPMTYDVGSTAALFGRVTVAMALLAVFGVVVGAAVRNRTIALVAVVAWLALGEDLVGALLGVDRLLPSAVAQSLVVADPGGATSAPVATLLLIAYVAVASCAGVLRLRRDVP